ncbi:unnamed protein product, partial [Pocillopora meandrina]
MKKMQVPHFSMKKASNMPTLKCMHVVFFLQSTPLFGPICYCFLCSKPCLEPEEFDDEEENSVQCQSCSLWCHWACTGSA